MVKIGLWVHVCVRQAEDKANRDSSDPWIRVQWDLPRRIKGLTIRGEKLLKN